MIRSEAEEYTKCWRDIRNVRLDKRLTLLICVIVYWEMDSSFGLHITDRWTRQNLTELN